MSKALYRYKLHNVKSTITFPIFNLLAKKLTKRFGDALLDQMEIGAPPLGPKLKHRIEYVVPRKNDLLSESEASSGATQNDLLIQQGWGTKTPIFTNKFVGASLTVRSHHSNAEALSWAMFCNHRTMQVCQSYVMNKTNDLKYELKGRGQAAIAITSA